MEYKHNSYLVPLAKDLRNDMTKEERRLWYDFLKGYKPRFLRQKIIGNFILDFYCPKAKIAIELDGSQHYSDNGKEKDKKKENFLKEYDITTIHFSNLEIKQNFEGICRKIDISVKQSLTRASSGAPFAQGSLTNRKDKAMTKLDKLISRYPALEYCKTDIDAAKDAMLASYRAGGKILICGNGGSAADAEHISGELLKGFLDPRKMSAENEARFKAALGERSDEYIKKLQSGIPAIPLTSLSAALTAYSNDVDAEFMYAQLVFALGKTDDVLIAISTSGNSLNCVRAAETAKALGIKTLALTGERESRLSEICDITIRVPETETYKVQEYHLPVYHYLCAAVEEELFKNR